ncbi:MAG: glycine cleavage system aminomethyltransferase GcvT [Rhodospirillaceae bacterium]
MSSSPSSEPTALRTTPLDALHRRLGARMVPFAGYAMPVQYPDGIIKEHLHCRNAAALFDVSHMGQAVLSGPDRVAALQSLVPGAIAILKPGRQRYTLFTNETGGILDDLMVTAREDDLFLVVNAACKDADFALLASATEGRDASLEILDDRALLALQGPKAVAAFASLAPDINALRFMQGAAMSAGDIPVFVTRSGYTGEDGVEISVAADQAEALAEALLALDDVAPAGLGSRDSLRLEAGLCLYGSDIDTETSPIEAGLAWTLGKKRKAAGDFPGAERILKDLADGPGKKRVGLSVEGRRPVRAHMPIQDPSTGETVGEITSGGFSPCLEAPIAMGYVPAALAEPGTVLSVPVRGTDIKVTVAALPFTPHRYQI